MSPNFNEHVSSAERTASDDASVADLVAGASAKLSTLMRQEIALAKAETRQEAVRAGVGAGLLAAAGILGLLVLLLVSFAGARWLSEVMDLGWAYLVVAGFWLVVALVLAVVGRAQLKKVNPKPERTAQTLRQVPDALKGR